MAKCLDAMDVQKLLHELCIDGAPRHHEEDTGKSWKIAILVFRISSKHGKHYNTICIYIYNYYLCMHFIHMGVWNIYSTNGLSKSQHSGNHFVSQQTLGGWWNDHTLLSGWLTLRVVPFYIPKLHETKRVEYESQFYIRRNDCLDDLWDKATTESYLKDGFQPWLKRCRWNQPMEYPEIWNNNPL